MLAACADALRHDRSQAELYLRRHAAWLARATGP
jgi:hypothetical protein